MICVIGGGKMGSAIVGGLVADGRSDITIVESNPTLRGELETRFPTLSVVDAPAVSDGAVIAVKPKDALDAISQTAHAGTRRILSIAAGLRLDSMEEAAGPGVAVLRAMPNIGALVGRSATALCHGNSASEQDAVWATELLSAVGTVVEVPESQMDAVTGLSGSGPAYVFLVVEALVEAGVTAGLAADVATSLATATVQGAAELLNEQSAAALRQMVTTPGGTTAAGIQELEAGGLCEAFVEAVRAASARSHELGLEPQQ